MPPAFVCSIVLGQALVMSPLYVEMPFLREHGWLAAPVVVVWLGAVVAWCFQPCVHLFWHVGDKVIMSTQPRSRWRLQSQLVERGLRAVGYVRTGDARAS
jgi:hypothetical protein